jgi:hypothetical protein
MRAVARLHPQLQRVLLPAYAPCLAFAGVCRRMRWAPARGHVPRGFCGASGALKEVQLVLVTAEPGNPHPGEQHLAQGTPAERLASAYRYATECLRSGKDLFHRNLRQFLALCWPHDTFDQHLRKTWLTDAVLCSAAREGGSVPRAVERECRTRYLEAQLALFPGAVIVALGGKAERRLAGIPGVVAARSVAPSGCNRRDAKESWAAAVRVLHERVRQA